MDVRLAIYELVLQTGRIPSVRQLAARLNGSIEAVSDALHALERIHAVALAPASSDILMAHPFSAVPTPYIVRTPRHAFWANCAWDALSIPAMLECDAALDVCCAECGEPIAFTFRAGVLQEKEAVVHFAVPPRRFWENVVFT